MVLILRAVLCGVVCAVAYSSVGQRHAVRNGRTAPITNTAHYSHVRNSGMSWGKASVLGETKSPSSASLPKTQYQNRKRDMELTMSLMNDVYQLTESVDDEEITSVVEFTDSGEMVFLKPEGSVEEVKKISGSWSVHDGVINLAISRTHSSKFAEFTVKNQLYGQIKEALSTLSAEGRIFGDDLCEDLSQALESSDTSGSFSLRRIEARAASKRAGLEELVWA